MRTAAPLLCNVCGHHTKYPQNIGRNVCCAVQIHPNRSNQCSEGLKANTLSKLRGHFSNLRGDFKVQSETSSFSLFIALSYTSYTLLNMKSVSGNGEKEKTEVTVKLQSPNQPLKKALFYAVLGGAFNRLPIPGILLQSHHPTYSAPLPSFLPLLLTSHSGKPPSSPSSSPLSVSLHNEICLPPSTKTPPRGGRKRGNW